MRDRGIAWYGVCLLAFALALRLVPLAWSPLPFNPDGIGYAALAGDVLALDRLPLERMATDQVGYTSLLTVVAAVAGESPLRIAQPTSAFLGATSVLVGVVLARRLALGLGWSRRDARLAALTAGSVLALEVVYLYRSTPTDEQTAALVLVPVVVLASERWIAAGDRGWAAVGALVVGSVPPLHNLSGLVAVLAVAVVAGVAVVRDPRGPVVARAGATGALVATYVFGYHLALARYTGAVIVQADRLVAVPGLFVAWTVLAVAGAGWFVTTSDRVRRGTVLAVVLGGFGLVALNAVRTVFPATVATSRPILFALAPLVVPAVLAGLAAHVVARDRTVGATTVALVAGPLAVVGTALTAALTFQYLAMLFRAQLFAHVPLVALAGVGVAGVARGRSERVGAVLAVAVVVAAAVGAPLAFAGLEVLPYKSVTTQAEFAATGTAASGLDAWTTDDHLGRVAGYFDAGGGGRGPTYRWLRGGDPPPTCPVLAQRSWTATGAQFYPQPPATLSGDAYRDWRARNDVVAVTVARDPLSVVVPRNGTAASC